MSRLAFAVLILFAQSSSASSVCVLHSADGAAYCDGVKTQLTPNANITLLSLTAGLKTLLDQGYKIVGQSESNGYTVWTLSRP